MSRDLPAHPNLEYLKKEAKDLLRELQRANPNAVERLRAQRLAPTAEDTKLSDAQHTIAREYGFASWARLKEHVESVVRAFAPADALKTAVIAGDARRVELLLEQHRRPPARLRLRRHPAVCRGAAQQSGSHRCAAASGRKH